MEEAACLYLEVAKQLKEAIPEEEQIIVAPIFVRI